MSKSFATDLMGLGAMSGSQAKLFCFGYPNMIATAERTATGDSLATAKLVTNPCIDLTTVASGTGIRLSDVLRGHTVLVYNGGANTVNIFPTTSAGVINALNAGQAFTLATTKLAIGYATGETTWRFVLLN